MYSGGSETGTGVDKVRRDEINDRYESHLTALYSSFYEVDLTSPFVSANLHVNQQHVIGH